MKAQDILVALKLSEGGGRKVPYAEMAAELGLSASELHAAMRRLVEARLLDDEDHVRMSALRNFLVHGLPYVFPAKPKEVTRGIPTAWAAPVMASDVPNNDPLPPVWPDLNGQVRGVAVKPLYPSVPIAIKNDLRLHALLALVDVLRLGRARERAVAEKKLEELLPSHG